MSPHLAATLNVAPAGAGENSAKHDFHNSIEIFSTQNLLVCCRQQHWWQRLVLKDEIDIISQSQLVVDREWWRLGGCRQIRSQDKLDDLSLGLLSTVDLFSVSALRSCSLRIYEMRPSRKLSVSLELFGSDIN